MGSLFLLLSLLMMTVMGGVSAFTVETLTPLKFCLASQSNAGITGNTSHSVVYGCNIGKTSLTTNGLTIRVTFSGAAPTDTSKCVPQHQSASVGNGATSYARPTGTTSGNNYTFAINSAGVTAGSVHLVTIFASNCPGLDGDYSFYIHYLPAPTVTSIVASKSSYDTYCSLTNSGSVYTLSSCYNKQGPSITITGENLDSTATLVGTTDGGGLQYACFQAVTSLKLLSRPTWNTATGTLISPSTMSWDILPMDAATGPVHETLESTYTNYAPGTACTIKTTNGITSTSFSIDWFTATTSLVQLKASNGVCTSDGNNLIDCAPFGSNGAQAITFVGTNFGPNDAPITIAGINDICTTSNLTRIPNVDEATCILKPHTGVALSDNSPSILALGVLDSAGTGNPTFSYGSTVVDNITCSGCACYGPCDYNGNGVPDSLCGCQPSESSIPVGTITLRGRNFVAAAAYDACNGNYQSTDGLTATCTAISGSTNTTRPLGATAGLLAYKTNHFNAVPLITNPVTYKSSSGGTNLFDITLTFTPLKSGRAFVRLVASSYTATEAAVKDGSGGGFKCSTGPVAVVAATQTPVTLENCEAIAGDKVVVYIDQADVGATESGYFGAVSASSNAVTLPTIVTSITSSSCAGECIVSGSPYLCGCPTSGFNLTVWGSWTSTPTDAALCGSTIHTIGTENGKQFYSCVLATAGNVGSFRQSSNNGAGNRVYFITNSFTSNPTIASKVWTSGTSYTVTVHFTASINGRYTVAIISTTGSTNFNATSGHYLDYSLNGGILCKSSAITSNTMTGGTQKSVDLLNCPQTIQGGVAKVYIDGDLSSYSGSPVTGTVGTSDQIVLPYVVYQITAQSGCQATCSGHPCGCNTNGAPVIRVFAHNLAAATPTDSGLCAGGTVSYTNGDGYYQCTLIGGSFGTSATSSNAGETLLKQVDYWTNSFNSGPTLGTIAYTGDGATDSYSVTFTFTASVAGRYAAALVANGDEGSWTYSHTRSGAGTNCELAVLTTMSTSLVEFTLTGCTMPSTSTYKVHVYIESASQTEATGIDTATATITLPPVVSSITVSGSSSCMQCSIASGKSTTNICGCAGGETITIHGKNLNGKTESGALSGGVCAASTPISSDSSFSCTLASVSVGSFNQVTFTPTGYGDVRAYYISNKITAIGPQDSPSSVSVFDYKTTFSISLKAQINGKVYAVAYASSGDNFVANATQVKSITHIPSGVQVCNAAQSGNTVTADTATTYTFTCGGGTAQTAFAMTNGWTARVFAYAEGVSEAATDYYGTVSEVQPVVICHSDCATCSRSELGYCLSCKTSTPGVHLETYSVNSLKYCCLAECATCGPRSNAGTSLTANSCASCNTTAKDHLSHDGQTLTYCCHGSCSTCTGNSVTQCTSCGGYNTGLFYNGMCKNGTYEIHGDPHFHGYLDQDYTVTGRPSAVYSIITDPWLQYSTRFIWYGDVYHGFDPTTNKPYDANVTYIGEIGMKFNWGNHEDRVYITVDGFAVYLNGRQLTETTAATKFGDGCSIVRGKKFIEIETKKFRVRFFLAGSKKHPFINQRVELLNWMGIGSHGLLGQTWKREQAHGINRNAIWEGHRGGVDFQFRSASFLEGHLWDYEIKENNVFGDDFTFNQYKFKNGN